MPLKPNWRRNLQDLVTVRRRNLPDMEKREQDYLRLRGVTLFADLGTDRDSSTGHSSRTAPMAPSELLSRQYGGAQSALSTLRSSSSLNEVYSDVVARDKEKIDTEENPQSPEDARSPKPTDLPPFVSVSDAPEGSTSNFSDFGDTSLAAELGNDYGRLFQREGLSSGLWDFSDGSSHEHNPSEHEASDNGDNDSVFVTPTEEVHISDDAGSPGRSESLRNLDVRLAFEGVSDTERRPRYTEHVPPPLVFPREVAHSGNPYTAPAPESPCTSHENSVRSPLRLPFMLQLQPALPLETAVRRRRNLLLRFRRRDDEPTTPPPPPSPPAPPAISNVVPEELNFVHQARVLLRLLELLALQTLQNLLGEVEPGERIDNPLRTSMLREGISSRSPDDGLDLTFAEFITALQGNLLANELAHSVRQNMARERPGHEPTAAELRLQQMLFFRAFRFAPRRPRYASGAEIEEDLVPVLLLGVRLGRPEDGGTSRLGGPSDSPNAPQSMQNTSTSNTSNGSAQSAPSESSFNNSSSHQSLEDVSESTPSHGEHSFFRNRNHRSRFRLENLRNSRRLEEIARSYGERARAQHGQRLWVIFVMGHLFSTDHPVLLAPTIMLEDATYEDLLALQAMLGRVKPIVATSEDIERSGGLLRVTVDDEKGVRSLEGAGDGEENDYESGDEQEAEPIENVRVVSDDQCLVCLTEYEDGDLCRRLKGCGHFFHRECIDEWLETGRNLCPLCRKKGVAVKKGGGPVVI